MCPRSSLAVARSSAILAVALLAACSSPFKRAQPEPPTLKSLASHQVTVNPDIGIKATEEDAARAYRDFLAASPREPQRQEALRRLGDLEMDLVDSRMATGETTGSEADYKAAVTRYQDFLKTYPNDSGNDRVLYQLARAYELSGNLETSLATLDKLVLLYPTTRYRDEAQFRRGELMFALREYPKAEAAYLVTMRGDKSSPYYERSIYMHG
ncbi:MAG TPA: tetratricopeptide repeat protein, partial [Burkholderiaceae bacterium]|nr:tetratricopeptide repeat protein [Burkholderiaceae bacterium]